MEEGPPQARDLPIHHEDWSLDHWLMVGVLPWLMAVAAVGFILFGVYWLVSLPAGSATSGDSCWRPSSVPTECDEGEWKEQQQK